MGPQRNEVTAEWRRLHNEEPSTPSIVCVIKSRRIRWAGHVARIGERKSVYRVLVEEPERKRPLGRHRRRWEDNIKMDLKEILWKGVEWICRVEDKEKWCTLLDTVINLPTA